MPAVLVTKRKKGQWMKTVIYLLHCCLLVGLSSEVSSVSDNDTDSALLDQRDSVFNPWDKLSAAALSWFCFANIGWLPPLFTDSLDTRQTKHTSATEPLEWSITTQLLLADVADNYVNTITITIVIVTVMSNNNKNNNNNNTTNSVLFCKSFISSDDPKD